jgi:hypothetical protein
MPRFLHFSKENNVVRSTEDLYYNEKHSVSSSFMVRVIDICTGNAIAFVRLKYTEGARLGSKNVPL